RPAPPVHLPIGGGPPLEGRLPGDAGGPGIPLANYSQPVETGRGRRSAPRRPRDRHRGTYSAGSRGPRTGGPIQTTRRPPHHHREGRRETHRFPAAAPTLIDLVEFRADHSSVHAVALHPIGLLGDRHAPARWSRVAGARDSAGAEPTDAAAGNRSARMAVRYRPNYGGVPRTRFRRLAYLHDAFRR